MTLKGFQQQVALWQSAGKIQVQMERIAIVFLAEGFGEIRDHSEVVR